MKNSYDYECPQGHIHQDQVTFEERLMDRPCPICLEIAQYQFPVQAVRGIEITEPFYAETLGHDVSGKRELKHILKTRGLVEAGDKVHGARNEETASSAKRVTKQPPRGISWIQRERELGERQSQVVEPDIRADF